MLKIKLNCTACGGEVVFEKKADIDQAKAHDRLHTAACEVPKIADRMGYFAEHGVPVTSEVVE